MIVGGICHRHGYWKGQTCGKCAKESQPNKAFYTTPDRLYYFTDNQTFKKVKEIHGKDHWKRELKKAGLTDDFKQGRRFKSPDEVKHPKKEFDKKGWTETMAQALKEKHKWMPKEQFGRRHG